MSQEQQEQQEQQRRIPIDYSSQNEEWMLLCDRLKEEAATAKQSNNDDAVAHVESMLMAARVGRLANIQCAALLENNDATTSTTASKASLQQYLHHTQHDVDTEPQQPLVDLLVKSIHKRKTKKQTSSSSTNPQRKIQPCTSLDIDAFFQEYPECIRSDWGMGDAEESDSDESGDDEMDVSPSSSQISHKSRRKNKPPTKSQKMEQQSTVASESVVDLTATTAAGPPRVSQRNESSSSSSTKSVPKPSADQENRVPVTTENTYSKKNSTKNGSVKQHYNMDVDVTSQLSQQTFQIQQPVNTFQYTPASPNSTASSRNGDRGHVPQQGQGPQQPQPPPAQAQQQPPNQMQPPKDYNSSRTVPSNPYQNNNPYNNQRPPAPSYAQNQYNQGPTFHQNQSAWANHVQEQNPFQTAREMSAAGISATNRRDHEDDWKRQQQQNQQQPRQNYRQWGQPPPPPQQQPPNNPYGYSYGGGGNNDPVDLPAPAGPMPGGTHIPDSLRQKFRPPGKINGQNDNNQRSTMNRNNHGRAQLNRPSSSGSNNGGQRMTNVGSGTVVTAKPSSKKDDDEEELPEELQHLDKELVLKIQNEIMESGETIHFNDIAGLKDAKQTVLELVVWPMQRPEVFTGLRRAPNGLLLFGPPGTGKTLIGKAIANETNATFFSISSSSLTSKWIGEGEKLVKTLFAVAAYREPAVVFIDEIDSLLTQRQATENEASRRIKTEFLVQLDGAGTSKQGRVLVIGATNRPQELDEAARRRFTKRMYIPLPAESDRETLLNVMLKNNKHSLTEAQIATLAKDTDGFSGADLKALCTDASMGPIRQLGAKAMSIDVRDIPPIAFKHFKKSLKGTRPSVAPDDLTQYIEWNRIYGSSLQGEEADDDDDDDDNDNDEEEEETEG